LATADAVVHIMSNFYEFGATEKLAKRSPKEAGEWTIPKLERDYNMKIFFPEIKAEVTARYNELKQEFTKMLTENQEIKFKNNMQTEKNNSNS
jgi:hypothetical protein